MRYISKITLYWSSKNDEFDSLLMKKKNVNGLVKKLWVEITFKNKRVRDELNRRKQDWCN